MPEGDTIFRAACTLHRALAGRTVTRFTTVIPSLARVDDDTPVAGRTVDAVTAVGKHLLMQFSGDLVLRTHLRMNGSWHIYRTGERWQRPAAGARIVIATDAFVAVGFDVPVAELLSSRALARHRELRRLGPDLLAQNFDAADVLRRLRARPDAAIEAALIDQHVMAGAGNVYKSEMLFTCGVPPFARVADLPDATLEALIATARRMLSDNARDRRGPRRTTGRAHPAAALWVYGRGGQPCRRCGTRIVREQRGMQARSTYWCPACQGRASQLAT